MSSSRLPEFLFVGTAKAGTTTIHRQLAEHPQVMLPRKESFFFIADRVGQGLLPYPQQRTPDTIVRSRSDFDALYPAQEERVPGEIGTGYLYHHKEAIPRILDTLGKDVRIFIQLRNPLDRTYSGWTHFTKDLHEPLTFEEALKAEAERAAKGWDFMWHHVGMSLYHDQVKAYMESFRNVEVLFMDDLKADAAQFMGHLCERLGVQRTTVHDTGKAFNRSGQARYRFLQRFITQESTLKQLIRPVIRGLMPDERRRNMRKGLKQINLKEGDRMDLQQRRMLRDIFADDVRRLSGLLGQDLMAKWKI
jgi:Sulfotransferase domain